MRYLTPSVQIVYNSALAITVTDAKNHLRVTETDEDAIIEAYLRAAMRKLENIGGICLLPATVTEIYNRFPADIQSFDLSVGPVIDITSLAYSTVDAPTTFTTIDASEYLEELNHNRAKLRPVDGWDYTGTPLQVRVIYTAGWANADAIPADIKSAIRLVLADLYANRTDDADKISPGVERASFALLAPYMIQRI